MPRKTDKRIRLIEAAKVLIHQQGFNLTTLADIAHKADVPLGNVYYYFKTKDAIGEAVIEKRAAEYAELLKQWDEAADPKGRLEAFINSGQDDLEMIAKYGCPVGGLCQELGKQGGALSLQAANLLNKVSAWATAQFKALGAAESLAAEYAASLLSSVQGMYLLTHTFKDPEYSKNQINALMKWLNSVIATISSKEEAFA